MGNGENQTPFHCLPAGKGVLSPDSLQSTVQPILPSEVLYLPILQVRKPRHSEGK